MTTDRLIVIDAANVVGSRPNGWWKNRSAATTALRDHVAALAGTGLHSTTHPWTSRPPLDIVMIAEGKAKGVASTDTVTIIDAPGNGDDAIVEYVTHCPHRHRLVVTSDRQLQQRIHDTGADTAPVSILKYGHTAG
ncbi:MAG TPA: NTP pyrophosphohydrolase [Candidatus Stackebrandtia faecavium]|nr:NTP pyrophosphohydrolase [Candidatus Stackebrandtia faecavium]